MLTGGNIYIYIYYIYIYIYICMYMYVCMYVCMYVYISRKEWYNLKLKEKRKANQPLLIVFCFAAANDLNIWLDCDTNILSVIVGWNRIVAQWAHSPLFWDSLPTLVLTRRTFFKYQAKVIISHLLVAFFYIFDMSVPVRIESCLFVCLFVLFCFCYCFCYFFFLGGGLSHPLVYRSEQVNFWMDYTEYSRQEFVSENFGRETSVSRLTNYECFFHSFLFLFFSPLSNKNLLKNEKNHITRKLITQAFKSNFTEMRDEKILFYPEKLFINGRFAIFCL